MIHNNKILIIHNIHSIYQMYIPDHAPHTLFLLKNVVVVRV